MRENGTNVNVTANNTNTMEERTMRVEVSGTANNYATTDNKKYTFVETYDITNPIDWQVDEMLSKANIGLQLLNRASQYCEAILGIATPYERTEKYLYLIQDVLDKEFSVSNLTDMIHRIFCIAYWLNIDVVDIDISDSNVNNKCIFFDAYVKICKGDNDGRVHLSLYHYNGKIQFIESHLYLNNTFTYVDNLERLKEVINEWE